MASTALEILIKAKDLAKGTIDKVKGSLSKPFYGLVATSWRYDSEGTLKIDESGNVTALGGGTSFVDINYLTKWIEYSAYSDEEQAQVYIED